MKALIAAAIMLVLAAPVVQAAPDDPQQPQECLGEPDPVNCLGQNAKCILRERTRFLYECWGILGP